jgi:hypothetical protein
MKKVTIILTFLFSGLMTHQANAQVGGGLVFGGDWYQWYQNPTVDGESALTSVGNVLLNVAIGPKFWVGGEKFSLSVEGHVNWGVTSFDMHEYKGMGTIAFPMIAKLNFGSLSSFSDSEKKGFYIGGGVQYTRTELYGLTADFIDNTTRKLFRTWIGEIGYGSGTNGTVTTSFVRVGVGDNDAFTLNVGSLISLNFKEVLNNSDDDSDRDNGQIQSFLEN